MWQGEVLLEEGSSKEGTDGEWGIPRVLGHFILQGENT